MQSENEVSVRTSEGVEHQIEKDLYSFHSSLISGLQLSHDSKKTIDLQIGDSIFVKLNEYLLAHGKKPFQVINRPIPSHKIQDFVSKEDYIFLSKLQQNELHPMNRAGLYLNIKHISDLCLASIAAMFIGMTVNEMREQFGIQEEYSQELEEKIKPDMEQYLQGCNISGE